MSKTRLIAQAPPGYQPRPRKPTLLVIFVHGFIGTEASFAKFPLDMQQTLQPLIPSHSITCELYPSYQTRGDLKQAVHRFSSWLKGLVEKCESDEGYSKHSNGVKVVLCGHSMGGLLIAEALLHLHTTRLHQRELWPRIIACIAFDSPFFGVNPMTILEAIAPVQSLVDLLTEIMDSAGFKLPVIGGLVMTVVPQRASASRYALLQYAILGVALYMTGKCLYNAYKEASDHWKFLRCIFEGRGSDLIGATMKVVEMRRVRFSVFYTAHSSLLSGTKKTFISLPGHKDPALKHFHAIHNTEVENVLQGHISMFTPKSNSAYSFLLKGVAKKIRRAFLKSEAQ